MVTSEAVPHSGTAAEATPPHDAAPAWTPPDPALVGVWRLGALASRVPAALGALAGAAYLQGETSRPVAAAAWGIAALAVGWLVAALVLPARRVRAMAYRVGADDLRLRRGIWWRALVVVPYARVEHVETRHAPLERRAGLATLVVHTAGAAHATIAFPGLRADAADALRELVARRASERRASPVGSRAASDTAAPDATSPDATASARP